MSSFVNYLTPSQTRHREYFQSLWDQAKYRANQLGTAYNNIASDSVALDTAKGENLARSFNKWGQTRFIDWVGQ